MFTETFVEKHDFDSNWFEIVLEGNPCNLSVDKPKAHSQQINPHLVLATIKLYQFRKKKNVLWQIRQNLRQLNPH